MDNKKKKIINKDKNNVEWDDKKYNKFYPGKYFGLKRNKFGTSLNDYNKYVEQLHLYIQL